MQPMQIAVVITGIISALLFMWVLKGKTVLEDESCATPRPFSLGRTILFFWTAVIVLSIHIIVWKNPTQLPVISTGMLTLMGIVITTSGTARTIDYMQVGTMQRHQDSVSEGFLTDIVSDEKGLSIHRFQLVVFTVIFGVYIIALVIIDGTFPALDNAQLGVLGFSSGAYAILKVPENKAGSNPQPQPAQQQPAPQPAPPQVQQQG